MESSLSNIKGVMICMPPDNNNNNNKSIKRLRQHHHNHKDKTIPFISAFHNEIPIGIPPSVDNNINIKLNRKYANKYHNSITIDYNSTNRKFIHNLYIRNVNNLNKKKLIDQSQKFKYDKVKEIAEDIRNKIRESEPITNENNCSDRNIPQEYINPSKTASTKPLVSLPSVQKNGRKRPPWAYTEEQIQQVEENELDELLKFTESLDFDNYINSLEFVETVDSLQTRIKQIEEEKKLSEDYIKDLENQINTEETITQENGLIGELKKHASDFKQSKLNYAKELHESYLKKLEHEREVLEEKVNKKKVNEDTRLVSQLKKEKSVRAIHSSASMYALVESINAPNLAIPTPKIITHEAEKIKLNVSNLPYLHRNPAI